MVDGTEQAGTPVAATGDGTATAAGTPAPASDGGTTGGEVDWKARAEESERKFQQSLGEKSANEERARRLQEVEEENQRLRASGYGTAPATAGNPQAEAAARMQQTYLALKQSEDPVHQLLAAQIDYTNMLDANSRFTSQLASIPTADQQAVAERARREGLAPALAFDRIKAERYDKEKGDLDARRKKLDEEEDARRRGRVDTTTTPVAARDLQSANITPSEYADLIAQAEKGDAKAHQRLREFDAGHVRMKDG
jgi:hypothetical protein